MFYGKERRMKKVLLFMILSLFFVPGCGDALLIGSGVAGAGLLANTLEGAKRDAEIREQYLIDLYNQGVKDGASVETLEGLKQKIRDTQLTKETVETGEGLLRIDWSDPKEVGGAMGAITALFLAWMNRKKKKGIEARDSAIAKFEGMSSPEIAGQLHDIVKSKLNSIG